MPRHLTRGIVVLGALAIAVAALVVAWGDAPAVLSALGRFPPLFILPVVLLTVWNYTLRWLRWNYYLRVLGVHGVSQVESALVFFSGFAMGLTPGKSGEVTKSYWLREIVGPDRAPLARTAPIVFAERLVDGIAMLLLATSGLINFQFGALALLGVAALACVAVGLIQARPLVHAVLNRFEQEARTNRVAVILRTAYDSARELLTWPRLALAVGIGIVSWAAEFGCLAALAAARRNLARMRAFSRCSSRRSSALMPVLGGMAACLPSNCGRSTPNRIRASRS